MSLDTQKSLTTLMPVTTEAALWRPEDLAGLLRHQMAADLLYDLHALPGANLNALKAAAAQARPPIVSFRDLLIHPHPPRALLQAVKQYAKAARHDLDRPIPEQIALVIYYAAIAAAIREEMEITSLGREQQMEGLTWCLSQCWLEATLKPLLVGAEEMLRQTAG